ncbi:hypothetical protein KC945_01100 [Candidatus Saccharibacteria bacterium]|jgi:hypothetical protein|nr:hypothetical protein [Candidatus Saccharibacteria bacterium]
MKRSDIAMIILLASLSMMAAFAIATNLSFLKVDEKGEPVDRVEKINSSIDDQPSATVFNKDAINPTVKTIIGGTGQQ